MPKAQVQPSNQERADSLLDERRWEDTFALARRVRDLQRLFPELDWVDTLRRAYERQEAADPEDNSIRTLAIHMAPELLGFKG